MTQMTSAVLDEIAAETGEWIAADLLARATRDVDRAVRYRSAAITVQARAATYRSRARRAWAPEMGLSAG